MAKRYAQSVDEITELVSRHKAVASEVLGKKDMTLFLGVYWESSSLTEIPYEWAKELSFNKVITYDVSEEDEDPYFLNIYASKFDWSSESLFSRLVLDVANEDVQILTFFDPQSGNVYAPYDGGADLFITSNSEVDNLKKKLKDWTSKRQDGL